MHNMLKYMLSYTYIEVSYMLKSKQLSSSVNATFITTLSLWHFINFDQFTRNAFFFFIRQFC